MKLRQNEHSPPSPAQRSDTVIVWDRFIRFFHWGLVIAVLLAHFTHGGLLSAHRVAGYAALLLVVARLAWGLVGGRHARFLDFLPRPQAFYSYLRAFLLRREPRFLGHNPLGALMIVLLLSFVVILGITGWMLDSPNYRDFRPLQNLHAMAADLFVGAIVVHVIGALYASWHHRENLIWAMLSGKKRAE